MKFANSEARRQIEKLARSCFGPFVASEMCEALLEEIGRKWFAFKEVPQLKDRPWAELFSSALAKNKSALLMVNVQVPGLPITWANEGFELLTGFNRAEAIGKNCRFMQGSDTQQDAVAALARAIRDGQGADVRIFNYRKNGTRFLNHITLHPVHDSDGVFRYCVALLGDAEAEALQEKDQRTLLKWLPSKFPSEAQEMGSLHCAWDASDDADGTAANFVRWEAQFERAATVLFKLEVAHDAELRFPALMGHASVLERFAEFCGKVGRGRDLALWLEHERSRGLPADEQILAVRELLSSNGISVSRGGADHARQLLDAAELARKAQNVLAAEVFVEWLKVAETTSVLAAHTRTVPRPLDAYAQRVWHRYEPPPELMGWLAAFIEMAESHPMSMVLSDTTIAGNPMVFVNKAFCTVTQYARDDVLGRNCRFMQGAETEASAVAQIQQSLRTGEQTYVKITNYRRSGQKFLNLLALQPVHDSNGLMRFCVGIQCEVTQSSGIETKLKRLGAMALLVPRTIEIGKFKPPSIFTEYLRNKDLTKHRGDNMGEADTNLMVTDRLRRVLHQQLELSDAGDVRSGVRFGDNHQAMLRDLSFDALCADPAAEADARKRDADQLEAAMTRLLWIVQAEAILDKLLPLKSAYDKIVAFFTETDPSGRAILSLEFLLEVCNMQKLGSDVLARRRCISLVKLARRAERAVKSEPVGGGPPKTGRTTQSPKPPTGSDSDDSESDDSSDSPAGGAPPPAQDDDNEEDDNDADLEVTDSALAMKETLEKHRAVLKHMAQDLFPVFVSSDVGADVIALAVREVNDALNLSLSDEERGSLSDLPIAKAKPFAQALADTFASISLGVILVDMQIPGLPIVWASQAFEKVTGYAPADALGRNCRFLQGPKTEPERVAEIVEAVRDGSSIRVLITNYRKDGATFVCDCLIHPVHDEAGKYIYSVGLLLDRDGPVAGRVGSSSDGSDEAGESARGSIDPFTLRDFVAGVLPALIPARYAHPWAEGQQLTLSSPHNTELVASERHACNERTNAQLIRLAWLTAGRTSDVLGSLTENPAAYELVKKYFMSLMPQRAPELKLFTIFDIGLEVSGSMRKGDHKAALSSARDLAELYSDGDFDDVLSAQFAEAEASGADGLPELRTRSARNSATRSKRASAHGSVRSLPVAVAQSQQKPTHEHPDVRLCERLQHLARLRLAKVDALQRFFQSAAFDECIAIVHRPENLSSSKLLIWGAYKLPADAFAFLHAFTATAQSYPFALTLSDVTLAGNPLIYVNQRFCEMSRYAMGEILGFNCRFLQGPRTEPKCIEAIQQALRRAIPCLLRITNYRKDGSFFNQLLALQPIHDSAGRSRFCIGVQAPVLPGSRAWLEAYASALALLPATLHTPPFEDAPISSVRCEAYVGELTLAMRSVQTAAGAGGAGGGAASPSEDSDADMLSDSDADSVDPTKPKPKGPKVAVPSFSTIEEPLQPFRERSQRTISAQLNLLVSGPAGGVVIAPADGSALAAPFDSAQFEENHNRHRDELKQMVRALDEQASAKAGKRHALLALKRKGSTSSYQGRATTSDELSASSTDPALIRSEAVQLTQLSWMDVTGERLGTLLASASELKPTLLSFGTSVRRPIGASSDGDTREEPRLDRGSLTLALDIIAAQVVGDADTLSDAVEAIESAMSDRWPSGMSALVEEEDDHARLAHARVGFDAPLRLLLHSIWPGFVLSEAGVELIDQLAREASVPPSRLTLLGFATTQLRQPWMIGFIEAVHALPVAVTVADLSVAGLPLVYVNPAFEKLTGYTMVDAAGRNCRFLQQELPESETVAKLGISLREQKPTRQTIVNFRKGGCRFVNEVCLEYIHSATGEQRYCIGLQADAEELEAHPELRTLVERVITLLPKKLRTTREEELELWEGDRPHESARSIQRFGCELRRPIQTTHKRRHVSEETKRRQYTKAIGAFTKLEWMIDQERSFQMALESSAAFRERFDQYLAASVDTRADELRAKWRLCCVAKDLIALSPPAELELAEVLYRECIYPYDSSFAPNPKYRVQLEASKMTAEFAMRHFVPFLHTPESDEVFASLELPVALDSASQLLWADYAIPEDIKLWLWAFSSSASSIQACIVVSDMTLPGSPLVFVNELFCRTTGYTKEEVLGRNCRFLQGPESEPRAVHEIVSSLRKASDCVVKITNYKRSGETFANLLAIRPVHDSNGRYRLCIGVQTELLRGVDNAAAIDLLSRIITALPSKVDVESTGGADAMHTSWLAELAAARGKDFGTEFESLQRRLLAVVQRDASWRSLPLTRADREGAGREGVILAGPIPGAAAHDAVSVVRFVENHERLLEGLGVQDVSDQFSRVCFLHNARHTLRNLLLTLDGRNSFTTFMDRQLGARAAVLIDTIVELWRLATADRYILRMKCAALYERLHGKSIDPLEAQELLQAETEMTLLQYASDYFPAWVTSEFCATMLHQLRTVRNLHSVLPIIREALPYFELLQHSLDAVPIAVVVVDMLVAGLPIAWTNRAFTWLTGYAQEDATGRNCAFLQGSETQAEAVATLIEAIRACAQVTVTLANYRKDGTLFQNELTLLPVHDDKGRFRYCIGILRDAAAPDDRLHVPEGFDADGTQQEPALRKAPAASISRTNKRQPQRAVAKGGGGGGERDRLENAELERLRAQPALTQTQLRDLLSALVQRTFPAHLQPRRWPMGKMIGATASTALEQARAVQVAFTKLDWLELPEKHFRESVVAKDELRPFESYLRTRDLETTLRFWLAASKLAAMSELAQLAKVEEAYSEFLHTKHASSADALAHADTKTKLAAIQSAFKRVTRELIDVHFVDFIYSERSDGTVARLMDEPADMDESTISLLWDKYVIPSDTARFVAQFAALFDKYPACICLSDMTLPGSPLVFVNAGFCAITGYKAREVLGRSCRFLQGSLTEPESVAAIMRALRAGEDCHVKIVNYTKAGAPFKSLLTLLAIFDSNGVYRYCMGIQFPITEQITIRRRFMRLSRLVCLLPRMLEVGAAKPVGPMHPRANRLLADHNRQIEEKARKAAALAAVGGEVEDEDSPSGEEPIAQERELPIEGAPAAADEAAEGANGEVDAPAAKNLAAAEHRPAVDKDRHAVSMFGLPGQVKAVLGHNVSREASAHRLSAALMATRDEIGTIVGPDGSRSKGRTEVAPRVFCNNLRHFLRELGAPMPAQTGHVMRGPIEGIDDNEVDAFDAVRPLEGFGPQEMYSKLMWMRHGTPELLRRLLQYAPAMANFKRYVRTVSHVSIEVIFYLEVVKLEEPMCSEDEQEIMAVFRRFLPAMRAPSGAAAYAMLHDQADATLTMLASEFLLDFVKSTAFVITFVQMRGIRSLRGTTEAQELFLELPARGGWQLPHVPGSRQLAILALEDEWVRIFHLCLDNHELAIILINMELPGLPIIFANKAFSTLTNFSQSEVLGQNCSFLQGAGTDASAVREVKLAVQELRSGARIELLNYRNNGEPFRNTLSLGFTRAHPGGPAKYAVGILVERTQGRGTLITQSQLRNAQEFISVLPRAARSTSDPQPPSALARIPCQGRSSSEGALLVGKSAGGGAEPNSEAQPRSGLLKKFDADTWQANALVTMNRLLELVPEGRDVFTEFATNEYFAQAFSKGFVVPKGRRGPDGMLPSSSSSAAAGLASRGGASSARLSSATLGGASQANMAVASSRVNMARPATMAGLSINDMKGTATRSSLVSRASLMSRTSLVGTVGEDGRVRTAEMAIHELGRNMSQDVRLSLHSANHFRERQEYGEVVLGFWIAVDSLKGMSGEPLKNRIADIFRVFAMPEIGVRRNLRGIAISDAPRWTGDDPAAADESSATVMGGRSAGHPNAIEAIVKPAAPPTPRVPASSDPHASFASERPESHRQLARPDSGSTITDGSVTISDLQRVMSSTLALFTFDLLPAFLRSRLLTGLASSLMQTSKDPELELAIRLSRSTAPQDADDWMALFCTVAESLRTSLVVCDMLKPGVPIMYVNKAFEQLTEYSYVRRPRFPLPDSPPRLQTATMR
jgi:PAS domain S-box-containing protein